MPFDDPDRDDPLELVAVELPGDETITREMAEAFAEEFAQLGFGRAQIVALFRAPHYTGAHQAWRLLGEAEIGRIVDASLEVWGSVRYVVTEADDEDPDEGRRPLRFFS